MIQNVAIVIHKAVDVVLVFFFDAWLVVWVVVDDVDVCGHCLFGSISLLLGLGIKFISIFYSSVVGRKLKCVFGRKVWVFYFLLFLYLLLLTGLLLLLNLLLLICFLLFLDLFVFRFLYLLRLPPSCPR